MLSAISIFSRQRSDRDSGAIPGPRSQSTKAEASDASITWGEVAALPQLRDLCASSEQGSTAPAVGMKISAGDVEKLISQQDWVQRLPIEARTTYYTFLNARFADIARSKAGASFVIAQAEMFLAALPELPASADVNLILDVARKDSPQFPRLNDFLAHYGKLIRSVDTELDEVENREFDAMRFRCAIRGVLRLGMYYGENSQDIVKAASELFDAVKAASSETDFRITSEDRYNLVEFMRGLISKGWDMTASALILNDVIHRQPDLGLALSVCGLSATKTAAKKNEPWQRRLGAQIPMAVEFLNIDIASHEELRTAEMLFQLGEALGCNLSSTSNKLFGLFEVTRCVGLDANIPSMTGRIQNEIRDGKDPEPLLDILLTNISRKIDNQATREAVLKLRDAGEDFGYRMAQLREQYQADVPDETLVIAGIEARERLSTQQRIFHETRSEFAVLKEIDGLIPLLVRDLRVRDDIGMSFFARFAAQACGREQSLQSVHCSSMAHWGPGIVLEGMRADRLFETSAEDRSKPATKYYRGGLTQESLAELLGSRIILIPNPACLVVSIPGSAKHTFKRHELSAVYSFNDDSNLSGSLQCIVGSNVIDRMLRGSFYDHSDYPASLTGVADLNSISFTPDQMYLEAKRMGQPFFDTGSASCIGGKSNSTVVLQTGLPSDGIQRRSAAGHTDRWGHTKKMQLLQNNPEQFASHVMLHQDLHPIASSFNRVVMDFAHRYAAYKIGMVGIGPPLGDGQWFEDARYSSQRLLREIYARHLEIHRSEDPDENASLLLYRRGHYSTGPMPGVKLSIREMSFECGNGIFQMPNAPDRGLDPTSDDALGLLCNAPLAVNVWEQQIMPILYGEDGFIV